MASAAPILDPNDPRLRRPGYGFQPRPVQDINNPSGANTLPAPAAGTGTVNTGTPAQGFGLSYTPPANGAQGAGATPTPVTQPTSTLGGFQIPQAPTNPIYGTPWSGSPYSFGGAGDQQSSMGFDVSGPIVDVGPNAPMEDIYATNRNVINTTGNVIGTQAANQLPYYQQLQQGFTGAATNALNQMAQTPGFTAGESTAISGDPNAPVAGYQADVASGVNPAMASYASGVGGAVSGLGAGLNAAQSKFSGLDTAVSNPALGFDPNATENQMTPQEVQNLQTAAMTSVGNQFQTAEDTLRQQAAAAGNTSPLAEAAARQQLATQEASSAGDAAVQAQLAAEQAQFQRAQAIEQQREGAAQTQAGLQATASTTEEAAAQAAAGTAGTAGLSAQQALGQTGVGQAQTEAQTALNAQQLAEQEASQRAQTEAQQRITGQNTYLTGVAGQQAAAQQGGQGALSTEAGVYGTQTSGLNANANTQSNFEVGKASAGDQAVAGVLPKLFADGDIVTEPTTGIVGERGPEAIIKLGRYKSFRRAA